MDKKGDGGLGPLAIATLRVEKGEPAEGDVFLSAGDPGGFLGLRQRALWLCAILAPDREDRPTIRAAVDILQQEFFAGGVRSVTSRLLGAVLATHHFLRRQNSLSLPPERVRAGITVAAIRPKAAFVAQVGAASSLLVRSGQLWRFATEAPADRSAGPLGGEGEPAISLSSSALGEGDLLALATGPQWSSIPDEDFLRNLPSLSATAAATVLYDLCSARVRHPTFSLMVVRVGEAAETPEHDRERIALVVMDQTPGSIPAEVREPTQSPAGKESLPARGWRPARKPRLPLPAVRVWTYTHLSHAPSIGRWRLGPLQSKIESKPFSLRPQRGSPWPLVVAILAFIAAAALMGMAGVAYLRSHSASSEASALAREAEALATRAETFRDKAEARRELDQAQALLERAIAIKPSHEYQAQAQAIHRQKDRIESIVRLEGPLATVPIPSLTQLVLGEDSLYAVGAAQGRMIKLPLEKGIPTGQRDVLLTRGQLVRGAPVGDIVGAAWESGRPAGGTLFVVEALRSWLTVGPKDQVDRTWPADNLRWGAVQAVAWASGSLYLLDVGEASVLRYARAESGFDKPRVVVLQDPRLGNGVDMSVATDLYVLLRDGNVLRFNTQGQGLDFASASGEETPVMASAIFVSPKRQNVYIADAGKARILEFTQEGVFRRQLKAPPGDASLTRIRGVQVDEATGHLYVVSEAGVLVYRLPGP